jgi:hypothetical protein
MGLGNTLVVLAGYHDVCFTSLFLPLRTPPVMTDVSLRPAAATTKRYRIVLSAGPQPCNRLCGEARVAWLER